MIIMPLFLLIYMLVFATKILLNYKYDKNNVIKIIFCTQTLTLKYSIFPKCLLKIYFFEEIVKNIKINKLQL